MTGITILDGGMGQELVSRTENPNTQLWATQVMIDAPHLVREIHDEYFVAGAEIATANTYAIHHDRLVRFGIDDQFAELHLLACRMAREACEAHGSGRVAGSFGPLDRTYVGDAGPPREKAAALYAEIARLQAPHVDLFLAESVPSVARARATIDGLEGHDRPVWLAITVDDTDGGKLRSGEPVEAMLDEIRGRGVEALLINCSFPEAVTQALTALQGADLSLGGYANGFTEIAQPYFVPGATTDVLEARRDLTPAVYADFAEDWVRLGATIVGGCCEVGPAHIAELSRRLKSGQNPG
ncbi:homocysteine S-methyltransferase family protein [Ovoidimarina sediminis]|uniref:homocysteine S-methyltransferase family protein n=1 Tax=Ovoidimarina sediminis TaxID=3079856 RepID=UPI00290F2BDE|nr:homocysteine S-methyltransferase family protein [Rhodophyticola sp. MJ-SS7]MDU8942592.1 homocysteine S-methyltransferase family protein [Rhodophyticola sp. MJ-SS7]